MALPGYCRYVALLRMRVPLGAGPGCCRDVALLRTLLPIGMEPGGCRVAAGLLRGGCATAQVVAHRGAAGVRSGGAWVDLGGLWRVLSAQKRVRGVNSTKPGEVTAARAGSFSFAHHCEDYPIPPLYKSVIDDV